MTRIKNMKIVSEGPCSCGSALRHWERYSGQTVACCIEVNCTEKSLIGVHVQKTDAEDENDWYIVPLCEHHSHVKTEIEISDSYRLIPSDTMEVCQRMGRLAILPSPLSLSGKPRSY